MGVSSHCRWWYDRGSAWRQLDDHCKLEPTPISRGAIEGAFAVQKDNEASVAMAVLASWSAVHGLAMLMVDGRSDEARSPDVLVEGVMRTSSTG
jgi:hypothetical protein